MSQTQTPLQIQTPGGQQGETSDLSFYATFVGTADNAPRRTADVVAGFANGAWGGEYLSLRVGKGGLANDQQALTDEVIRLTHNGATLVSSPSISDNSSSLATTAFTRAAIGYVTPEMFGAVGNASTDDTNALQAAIDTGLTVRLAAKSYKIMNGLKLRTPGQIIEGQGRTRSTIFADNTFNIAASANVGLLIFSSGEPGPYLRDFNVRVDQGSPQQISDLIQYPALIFAQNTPRFTLERLGIYNGLYAIDMRANCGGAYLRDVQLSAYKNGFAIDGSIDSVRMEQIHCYVFDIANVNLMNANVVWFSIGRVDDLKISDSLTIEGTHFNFYSSAPQTSPYNNNGGGAATGSLMNHDFDGGNVGIQLSDGNLSVMGGYFACSYPIQQSGGALSVYGTSMGVGVNAAVAVTGGTLILSGSRNIFLGAGDFNFATLTNGYLMLNDNYFSFSSNSSANLTQAKIRVTGGRLIAKGNRVDDRGSGSGTSFIEIKKDDFHVVASNAAPGWTFIPPPAGGLGGAVVGVYSGNAFSPAGHT